MSSIAKKHSMDIPHVTSVELPLIIKNEDRAIDMLGGKERISKVISTLYKPSGGGGSQAQQIGGRAGGIGAGNKASKSSNGDSSAAGGETGKHRSRAGQSNNGANSSNGNSASSSSNSNIYSAPSNTENLLELRLRKDPFHHPIQSLINTTEKILLKVSIPKEQLPKDYFQDPTKYKIRDLIQNNKANDGPDCQVQPVAIIDNTYLFKSMTDFQVSTKKNKTVQDFNSSILNGNGNFHDLNQYFESHENFQGISDYKDIKNYENVDHQLPPPPLFLPIQFPFDYKYQKNPLTATMRDAESGEIRVISKKLTPRLHTIIVDFHNNEIPQVAARPLQENYEKLTNEKTKPAVNSLEHTLLECIEWLRKMFERKPIWTRKHLEDIVPRDLKRVIKQALPYVSYIYKSGPWRFCNVKFGSNPKEDKSFWKYQSEYFRIPGLRFNKKYNTEVSKICPPTLDDQKDSNGNDVGELIEVSLNLFFDGVRLPRTITYQVGDLLDEDIQKLISDEKKKLNDGEQFFREKPDFQDGWINKQTMECIRRIIRYKLLRLVKDEKIDEEKVKKIISTDYTKSGEGDEEEEEEEDEEDEEEEGEEADSIENFKEDGVDEETLIKNLSDVDGEIASGLEGLLGFIKQDLLER